MTNEEQQIALCEWAGWKNIEFGYLDGVEEFDKRWKGDEPGKPQGRKDPLPNTDSLDALHEMEKQLGIDESYKYGEHLRKMTGNTGPKGGHFVPNGFGCFALVNATAAQRREALLRTIGKWRD